MFAELNPPRRPEPKIIIYNIGKEPAIAQRLCMILEMQIAFLGQYNVDIWKSEMVLAQLNLNFSQKTHHLLHWLKMANIEIEQSQKRFPVPKIVLWCN